MNLVRKGLSVLFERPSEPLCVPKGSNVPIYFVLPADFIVDKIRHIFDAMSRKFEAEDCMKIEVRNTSIPDLTIPLQLPRSGGFSIFIPKHKRIASYLIEVFMNQYSIIDLLSVAAFCRDRLNPYLFIYALSIAIIHRKDTKDIILPNYFLSFPGKFIDSSVFSVLRGEASVVPIELRQPVVIPRQFTANEREPEEAIAYFREDIGANIHHWHWHLVYPGSGNISHVAKDRRGEQFYYMHQQLVARYNVERICNGLSFVKGLDSFREAVREGYFPKLDKMNSNRAWPSRPRFTTLCDVLVPEDEISLKINDMERWQKLINIAINNGFVLGKENQRIPLDEISGIDILGNVIESSILSPNETLYGDLHNSAHTLIAYCHDPDGRFMEGFGVMGDSATALRDPIFFRWHETVNNLFVSFKNTLPCYTKTQLLFQDIILVDFYANTPNQNTNKLYTYWEESEFDLSRGIDFVPRGPLLIKITHLQHKKFSYTLKISNTSNVRKFGTVRVFMLLKHDAEGRILKFNEQRKFAVEVDKFAIILKPGLNDIFRKSDDSSVTVPYEVTFRNMNDIFDRGPEGKKEFNNCSCGWPDHLLIPKGTKEGFNVSLFAMVSDNMIDRVTTGIPETRMAAVSYCGLMNEKYPDKQAIGYPFDRKVTLEKDTLEDFLTPNMKVAEVTIIHKNITVPRAKNNDGISVAKI